MKILFYGGCHATVLKKAFEEYSLGDHEFDVITNYVLIAKKELFPYEIISKYDYIVFNPIFNKGDWNTVHIENYCLSTNTKVLKYPWMQWGGYWIDAKQRLWGGSKEWGSSYVNSLADKYPDINEYHQAVQSQSEAGVFAHKWIDKTTSFLQRNEINGNCDFVYSDWIHDNYSKEKLFLTPDHPSTFTYKKLITDISSSLGIDLDSTFYDINHEFQSGVYSPIIGGVKSALKLEFVSDLWAHKEIWRGKSFDVKYYIDSYHKAGNVYSCKAKCNTFIKHSDGSKLRIRSKTSILIIKCDFSDVKHHYKVKVVDDHGNMNDAYLYRPHWDLLTAINK